MKSIYTLNFERAVEDDEAVVQKVWTKLNSAMLNRGTPDIALCSPD